MGVAPGGVGVAVGSEVGVGVAVGEGVGIAVGVGVGRAGVAVGADDCVADGLDEPPTKLRTGAIPSAAAKSTSPAPKTSSRPPAPRSLAVDVSRAATPAWVNDG